MKPKKRALEFEVYPLWKFLEETYGTEQAFSLFAPYKGANVTAKIIDQNTVEVYMPLVISNTNYVGTHFGGSLYSMCDPFYMFILLWRLGNNYIVWDKGARIDFLKPGRGTVKAIFRIPDTELEEIKKIVEVQKKVIRTYETKIIDDDGTIVAKVSKDLYIRRRN